MTARAHLARADLARPAAHPLWSAGPQRLRWDGFQVVLVLLVLVQVWRVHDLVPGLALPGVPILCTLAALLVFWLDRDPRRRLGGLNQPVVRAALGILLLATISIPGSMYLRYSAAFVLKDYLRTVVLMLLIAASVRGLADMRRLAWLQVAGATLLSAVVVAGAQITSDRSLRSAGYYDANDLAMLIVSTLPLVLYLWRRPAGLWSRVSLAGATALLMVTLGQTGSRGGFLAFLAVVGYLLVGFRGISRAKRAVTVTVLGILLVVVASDRYFARIETIFHPSKDYNWSGRSETGRMEIWKRGIGYMVRHPILGVGAAAFPVAEGTLAPEAREQRQYGRGFKWSAAHNSLIQVGAELGVGGLILFVALLVGAFRTLSHARRRPEGEVSVLAQVLTASLVAFVVAGCFLSQAYSAYLYTLLGMSVGLARIASPADGLAQARNRVLRRFGP
jgi:O-antigen ligase